MNDPRWLVVRFGAIGDCILAAWPATAIRLALPGATLVWAVEDRCAAVIDEGRLCDKVEAFPRRKQNTIGAWAAQYRRYAGLRRFRFDVGVDLHGHLKTALCLRLSGARRRVSFAATDALARSLNPQLRPPQGDPHVVERHFAELEMLGEFPRPTRPIVPEPPAPFAFDRPVATLMMGASHPTKHVPPELWQEVALGLSAEGYQVVALGGSRDPDLEAPGAISLVGRAGLAESMGAVRASAVHLAPDTWTGHAAAALGVPVVSLFGVNHNTPERYRPYTSIGAVLQAPTPADLDPAKVVETALELVETHHA